LPQESHEEDVYFDTEGNEKDFRPIEVDMGIFDA